MSDGHPSPRRVLRQAWDGLRTVYYANSVSWRALKSGALVFLGFFLWAGSNVLLSYRPGWTLLHYPMAYGSLLVVYGPLHHIVVIPLALRWRRTGGTRQRAGRHLPNGGLALFLVAAVVLGTAPAGPMTIDFASHLEDAGADVNPDLLCVRTANGADTVVHCHLSESTGVDRVVVYSGGTKVAEDRDPPFEFTVRASELERVVGEKQFRVELLGPDGQLIRQYTRTLSMIEAG